MRRIALPALAATGIAGIIASVAVAASSPSVTTGAASKIKDTSAVLSGSINPNGAATSYYFQWGPTTAYGFTGKTKSAGSGRKSVSVSATPSGLLPGTVYHYRLVAGNSFGLTMGRDRTFKTAGHPLPGAVTGAASSITSSSAIITGEVLTNGASTDYYFQYGPAAGSYGFQTTEGVAKASSTPVGVAAPLTLLASGATIHYRLVVIHSGFGPIYGADAQFTTLPLARPYPAIRAGTAPHRDGSSPFVFTTIGALMSASFPASAECNGTVTVKYLAFGRQVAFTRATVQSNCAFGAQMIFTHTFAPHPGGHRPSKEKLQVQLRFHGNAYLAPFQGPSEHVVVG